jgi:hypothetical protein
MNLIRRVRVDDDILQVFRSILCNRKNTHFRPRQTDQVRMASSLASEMNVQYLTTCVTCLVLASLRSWALTLVILSAVPLLMIVQGLSQVHSLPTNVIKPAEQRR